MGRLFDLCRRVSDQLERSHTEPIALVRAKGEIAAKAGFLVTLVSPNDPDDAEKIRRLQAAAHELGLEL